MSSRWRRPFHADDTESSELREEIGFYLEMRTRELIEQGVEPEEARRKALEAFGDPRKVEREVMMMKRSNRRRNDVGDRLSAMAADMRYALRFLMGNPGFTAVVLGTLALGIGANTAIFSLFNGVLLRSPGVDDPESLVAVYTTSRRGFPRSSSSYPDYIDYRDRTGSLADLAATTRIPGSLGDEARGARPLTLEAVTGNTFGLLGVRAARGRMIRPTDDRYDAGEQVVVLSDRLWRTHFGSDPGVVGSTVRLSGQPFEVVGVAPPDFSGLVLGDGPDAWVPMQGARGIAVGFALGGTDTFETRGARWIGRLVGRVAPGSTVDAVRSELFAVSEALREDDPGARGERDVTVDSLERYLLPLGNEESLARFVWLLLGVVGTTLLLASANLANLLLARASTRRGEIGVRMALGAGRGRLVGQLLTESLLLGLGGGALGLVVATGLLRVLGTFDLPGGVPISSVGARLDGSVLVATASLSVITALLFGLVPALQTTARSVATAVRDAAAQGGTRRAGRLRAALVSAQMALCLLLLIGSGLFLRTLDNALGADVGFDVGSVAAVRFDLGSAGYDDASGEQFVDRFLEGLRRLPDTREAAVSTLVPFQGGGFRGTFFTVDGYEAAEDEELRVDLVFTSPGLPGALGMELLDGRDFSSTDVTGGQDVTIVSRTMAEQYWPDGRAVGGTVRLGENVVRVVGVAEDVHWGSVDEDATNFMYVPLAQSEIEASGALTAVVRADGDPRTLLGPLRAELRALDSSIPPRFVATMDELLGAVLMPQRLGAVLLSAFGLLAMVIALVGIVGVVSYRVRAQRRALGVRIALGAGQSQVRRLILRGIAGPIAVGLGIGLLAAATLGGVVAGFLYEIEATDPVTYVATALLLGAVALAASLLPAREAGRVDPVQVLRTE